MTTEAGASQTSLDRDLGPSCARSGCQNTARHSRKHGRYCSDACRAADRKAHPTVTRCQKILGRLQVGPCTGLELLQAGGGIRYGARIADLRKRGHDIRSEQVAEGIWRYTLVVVEAP